MALDLASMVMKELDFNSLDIKLQRLGQWAELLQAHKLVAITRSTAIRTWWTLEIRLECGQI